jgi:hypothetical protein
MGVAWWSRSGDIDAVAGERQFTLRTLDFLFLQGTQALEMHLRFLPSSPLASLLLLRPFLAAVSGGWSAAALSMAESMVRGSQNVGLEMAGRALTGDGAVFNQRAINQRPERRICRGSKVPGDVSTWLATHDSSRALAGVALEGAGCCERTPTPSESLSADV